MLSSTYALCGVTLAIKFVSGLVSGFTFPVNPQSEWSGTLRPLPPQFYSDTVLCMGKGFNSAKNKQLQLARKFQKAKEENNSNEDETEEEVSKDREEFAKLLQKHQPPKVRETIETNVAINPVEERRREQQPLIQNPSGPKVRARDMKRRKKKQGKDNKNEDDQEQRVVTVGGKALRYDFEQLLGVDNGGAKLGPIKAAALVPWVPPFVHDYLLVVADPRAQSTDFTRVVEYLSSSNNKNIAKKESNGQDENGGFNCIAIAADLVPVLQAFVQRRQQDGSDESSSVVPLFSDSSLQWMKRYSCVDDNSRWALSMLLFDSDGILVEHQREVDPSKASQIAANMVAPLR